MAIADMKKGLNELAMMLAGFDKKKNDPNSFFMFEIAAECGGRWYAEKLIREKTKSGEWVQVWKLCKNGRKGKSYKKNPAWKP